MQNETYNTVSEAISGLRKKGYTIDFNLMSEENCVVCSQRQIVMSAEDFEIDSFYRFDGGSDPGDEMILYAISSTKFNAKGVLLNAYGNVVDLSHSRVFYTPYSVFLASCVFLVAFDWV